MARSRTASDQLVERLIEWGIDTVFGLPGDGINGVMEALRTHSDRIRFIHTRHEESAALAACAYGSSPAVHRLASRRPRRVRSTS
jgi:pyruvate dehydrogenase (quinone)/pyruvate oxidase